MTRIRFLGTALVAAAILLSTPLTGISPAQADDSTPPSWAEIQAAKKNAAATQAEIARVRGILTAVQQSAAQSSEAAVTATAAAAQAHAAAVAAADRLTQLRTQQSTAQAQASQARSAAARLAAGLYRTQSSISVSVQLITSTAPESLLARLGLLDVVSGSWGGILAQATVTEQNLSSLGDQAQAAQQLLDEADRQAAAAASTATAAAATAAAAVKAASTQISTLTAQLASLNNTTAALEHRAWLAQQVAAQPTPAPPPAGGGSGGSGSGGSSAGGGSGSGGGSSSYGVIVDPAGDKAYARGAIGAYNWGDDQYSCLVSLWNRESGWRADAYNASSGAYGIPQSLPGSKMAAAGPDWRTNGHTQIDWGLSYISNRYGSPCGAWAHSQATGWY